MALPAIALLVASTGALLEAWWGLRLGEVLAVLSWAAAGFRVFRGAISSLLRLRRFDERALIAVSSGGALALGEVFEAAFVVALYVLGEGVQGFFSRRARASASDLLSSLRGDVAVLRGGRPLRVPPEEVRVGESFLVRPGERAMLDGVVVSGRASLDLSHVTGESIPREVGPGDEVVSGSLCLDGALKVEARSPFEGSYLSQMRRALESSLSSRGEALGVLHRFVSLYTPAAVSISLLSGVALALHGLPPGEALYRALTLLVLACPCALALSIPTAYILGTLMASSRGVLLRSPRVLDRASSVGVVAFDKTGTLTEGRPRVLGFLPLGEAGVEEVASLVLAVEEGSNHPAAKALLEWALPLAEGGPGVEVEELRELPGRGVIAETSLGAVAIGNGSMMEEMGVLLPEVEGDRGGLVFLALEGKAIGAFRLGDELKESAEPSVEELKAMGFKAFLLTGDSEGPARDVASKLGLEGFRAGLRPEEKAKAVEELGRSGEKVAFVGDGINDALALSRAHLGVAVSSRGLNLAASAADAALADGDLRRFVDLLRLGRALRRALVGSVSLVLGVKTSILSLSLLGRSSMWQAVLADSGLALLALALVSFTFALSGGVKARGRSTA